MAVITLRSLGFYGTSCVEEEGKVLSRLMKLYFDFHSCDRENTNRLSSYSWLSSSFPRERGQEEKHNRVP